MIAPRVCPTDPAVPVIGGDRKPSKTENAAPGNADDRPEIERQRQASHQCTKFGEPLGFLQRLAGADAHKNCPGA